MTNFPFFPCKDNSLAEAHSNGNLAAALRYLKEERGVTHLVHFTPMENLPGILDNGFVPLDMDLPEGYHRTCLDERKYDTRKDILFEFEKKYPGK